MYEGGAVIRRRRLLSLVGIPYIKRSEMRRNDSATLVCAGPRTYCPPSARWAPVSHAAARLPELLDLRRVWRYRVTSVRLSLNGNR
jgi:hypothetical protein